MKKKSFLLLACAALFAASCQKNSYKLQGEIEGAQDGDSVIIAMFENGRFVPSDTIPVKGNTFQMEGTADSTLFCSYFYSNSDSQHQGFFFIEPGNIEVKVTDKEHVGGTANNDAYQKYSDELEPLAQEMRSLYEAGDDSTTVSKIEALNKKITDLGRRTITANIDNITGFVVFLMHYGDMEASECLEFIEKMPDMYKNQTIITSLVAEMEGQKATEPGNLYKDFTLTDINGNELTLSKVVKENKLTLIDCWASWCGPCMAEMPNVVKVYEQYHAKGLEIIGVSFDQNESSWKEAIERMNMTWPQASELKGWDNTVKSLYAVNAIPFTLLIDQDGKIVGKNLRGEELAAFVAEKLGE